MSPARTILVSIAATWMTFAIFVVVTEPTVCALIGLYRCADPEDRTEKAK